ncbi:MAG: DUF3313 domain-containing protein [Rhodocyclaceae bacterium]|nr:DUF3313 domain-containing protein [Rhodocyclaceae bacterium]
MRQMFTQTFIRRSAGITLLVASAALLSACGGGGLTESQKSGFMTSTEYNRLVNVGSPAPGVNLYRYVSPDFKRSDWHGVMIDPVILFQTALKGQGKKGLTEETIYETRMIIDKQLKEKASSRFNVVDKPGPGIARLSIAITGAEVEGDGFKPWNVIPVSAVLYAAQKATGLDSKTPMLVVEAKMRDSVTGKILGEGVYTMAGETFRTESSTPEAFQKLAIDWVTTAVRVSVGMSGN